MLFNKKSRSSFQQLGAVDIIIWWMNSQERCLCLSDLGVVRGQKGGPQCSVPGLGGDLPGRLALTSAGQ